MFITFANSTGFFDLKKIPPTPIASGTNTELGSYIKIKNYSDFNSATVFGPSLKSKSKILKLGIKPFLSLNTWVY